MLFKQFLENKKNKQILWITVIIIILIVIWIFLKPKNPTSNLLKVAVKKGSFEISVTTTGELEAKNSVNIMSPNVMNIEINSVKIEDIVPNGTFVNAGDYIATLNKSVLLSKIKEYEKEVEKANARYISTKLDTTIELKGARNELLNQKYGIEETELELKQSIYEPPATIRQVEIRLDKAKRTFEQSKASYKLKVDKQITTITEVINSKQKAKQKLNDLHKMLDKFTIYAPKAGMVVHPREAMFGRGENIIGRELGMFNPVVATLPNLKELISKTYVNEIDISKIVIGQKVLIGIDAFPNKIYEGIVTDIANIGNQYMSGNAKLFEVLIELYNPNNILKPAMTTKNKIIINTFKKVIYLPLECIHNDENMTYVYTGRGNKKQIIVGKSNENEIIILEGLKEGELVCFGKPENTDSFRLIKLDEKIVKKYKEHNKKQIILRKIDKNKEINTKEVKNMNPEEFENMEEFQNMSPEELKNMMEHFKNVDMEDFEKRE
jgi:multidrug efflux pump subunit AcrA (membrane-fusion protein)